MGLLWSGYTLIFWGYCQIKGYDISLRDIVQPTHYKGNWPPKLIVDPADRETAKVAPGQHPGDAPWSYPHGGGQEA
jgi:hypothetical protein